MDTTTFTPVAAARLTNGVATFEQVPAGEYAVTLASSGPFGPAMPITIEEDTSPALDVRVTMNTETTFYVPFGIVTCVDPDRAGEFEFITQSFSATDTTTQCRPGLATGETGGIGTLLDEANSPVDIAGFGPNGVGAFNGVAIGTYSLSIELDGQPAATSAPFDIPMLGDMRVVHYVASEASIPPTPAAGNAGEVYVSAGYCVDPARAGEVDFQVLYDFSDDAATTTNCSPSMMGTWNLVLVDAGGNVVATDSSFGGQSIRFQGLPQGEYAVRDTASGAQSALFPVNGSGASYVLMRTFVAEATTLLPLEVAAFTCLDPDRIGAVDYSYLAGQVSSASTSDCQIEEAPPTVTITNVDTNDQYSVSFGTFARGVGILDLPAGTYIASASGYEDSAPFTLDTAAGISLNVLSISLFVGEDGWTPPPAQQSAVLTVLASLCSNVTVEDEYRFIIVGNVGDVNEAAAPTDMCSAATTRVFSFVAIPVDDQGNEGTPVPLQMTTGGLFISPALPIGTYLIRETFSGNTSDPVTLTSQTTALYLEGPYLAPTPTTAPVLTPTAIPTTAPGQPTPAATATATAAATATADATNPAAAPTATKGGTASGKVSALPNTGQGTSDSSGSLLLMLTALGSLLLLAAGVSVRRARNRNY